MGLSSKTANCIHCGTLFRQRTTRSGLTKYCSPSCWQAAKSARAGQGWEARFWAKIDKSSPDGCWEWTAAIDHYGYGKFAILGAKDVRHAHRVSYFLATGVEPGSQCVLHKCDNRKCVNPEHLFLGSKADNTRDMIQKGRQRFGRRHVPTKLTSESVLYIRQSSETNVKIAMRLGVSPSLISRVRSGDAWRDT